MYVWVLYIHCLLHALVAPVCQHKMHAGMAEALGMMLPVALLSDTSPVKCVVHKVARHLNIHNGCQES